NIRLMVDDLPVPKIMVHQYLMDAEHSNSYSAWQKMGSPQPPDSQQKQTLEQAARLEEIANSKSLSTKNGTAEIRFRLARQGVTLLKITW
ncbi:MAG: beta-xylosidase, partial [Acidobacteriota bacterium]|nr:beta-xylosidase [Acidobacteriota bacterium]